jgi:hypothetical protein
MYLTPLAIFYVSATVVVVLTFIYVVFNWKILTMNHIFPKHVLILLFMDNGAFLE